MPHFSFIGPLEKPLNVRLMMNALRPDGSRAVFLVEVGLRDDEKLVGNGGERNPALLATFAVYPPATTCCGPNWLRPGKPNI